MAQRRMFSRKITESDQFLDMSMSAQVLYFHVNMQADDDGFVGNVKTIKRMIGASDDDLRLLITKEFLIPFETGVVVIRDWKIHNYIRKDRYTETFYKHEKAQIELNENEQYEWSTSGQPDGIPAVDRLETNGRPNERIGQPSVIPNDDFGLPTVDERLPQDRLGKVRLGEVSSSSSSPSKNTIQDVFLFYQNNFGLMSPYLQDDLTHWVNDLSAELVIDAMKRAIEGQKNYNYAKGILKRWLVAGIKTMEQVEASEMQFERNKQQQKTTAKPKYQKQKYEKPVPDWMNQKPTEPMTQSATSLNQKRTT